KGASDVGESLGEGSGNVPLGGVASGTASDAGAGEVLDGAVGGTGCTTGFTLDEPTGAASSRHCSGVGAGSDKIWPAGHARKRASISSHDSLARRRDAGNTAGTMSSQ